MWRDVVKPIGILKSICVLRGWVQPTFKGKGSTLRCYVNGNEYKMKYFGKCVTIISLANRFITHISRSPSYSWFTKSD